MAFTSDIPELRPPKSMYANVAELGAMKASQSPIQTFILGILSGCHIAFGKRTIIKLDAPIQSSVAPHIECISLVGAFLVLTVGGACPGIAQTNPGLQKIISGAFGLPFGNFLDSNRNSK